MTYRLFGVVALGAAGAVATLFLLRMTNIITTYGSAYIWANRAALGLGLPAICSSVLYAGGRVLGMTRGREARARWAAVLASCLGVLCVGAFCLLIVCLGMNFMGQ